jgi:hypothetical protein
MSFEFREGDIVKIEGVLERTNHEEYPLRLRMLGGRGLSFTLDGSYHICDIIPTLQLVSRPKKKVTKWNWVYSNHYVKLFITTEKYPTPEALIEYFGDDFTAIQKIDSTAEEFEE